jgi:hypothetical protein
MSNRTITGLAGRRRREIAVLVACLAATLANAQVAGAVITDPVGETLNLTVGQAFNGTVAHFASSDSTLANFDATIDWGDGSPATAARISVGPPCATFCFDVAGSHTYAAAGTYPTTIVITNSRDMSTATAHGTANVADASPAPSCSPVDRAVLHSGWPEAQPGFTVSIAQPLADPFSDVEAAPSARGAFRRGERGVIVRKKGPPKAGPTSKSPDLRFYPGIYPLDPIVAVSNDFIVATDAGNITFFAKKQPNNQAATPLAPGANGAPTSMSMSQFFGGLIAPTNPDGSVNQNNINCHLALGTRPAIGCDPTKPPLPEPDHGLHPQDACVSEFYDTRVFYRPDDKRFVVIAQARNTIWRTADWMKKTPKYFADKGLSDAEVQKLYDSGPEARRYIAIAVSRTPDPRDGFNQYITTTSNYADWPLGAVGERGIVVGHREPPESGKPAIYWFGLTPAENNVASPPYKEFSLAAFGGGGAPKPAAPYGDAEGLFWFINDQSSPSRIDALADKADLSAATPFGAGFTPPHGKLQNNGIASTPVYRDGRVCAATGIRVENDPFRDSIRVTCTRVSRTGPAAISASTSGQGVRDRVFGLNAPQDTPGDRVSYENPALTVNEDGDILIAYVRFGAKTKKPLKPEARYTLWYHDEDKPRRSRVLKLGEGVCCASADNRRIDLMSAVVDPTNDATVWMTDAYAKGSSNPSLSVVVGRVKP